MDLQAMVEQCAPAVAPATMTRIVRVESGGRAWAIGYHITRNGVVYRLTEQPKDVAQAVAWATRLSAEGYQFDAGIAQVNSANFARLGLHPGNVFDPCTNLQAASVVLQEFYARSVKDLGSGQIALQAAISAYQTGSPIRGYETGYVAKVLGTILPGKRLVRESAESIAETARDLDQGSLGSQTSIPFGIERSD